VPVGGRSRASPILGSLSLAFSARNMPPARRAAVPAYPRFRSASPPPASPPPPPAKSSTPHLRHRAPPASNSFYFSRQSFTPHHHRRTSHHAFDCTPFRPCGQWIPPPESMQDRRTAARQCPPKIPVSMREEWRFVESKDVVGVFPSRCRLRALSASSVSSSFSALPHS
jgi:hypothetical protein